MVVVALLTEIREMTNSEGACRQLGLVSCVDPGGIFGRHFQVLFSNSWLMCRWTGDVKYLGADFRLHWRMKSIKQ